MTKRLSPSEWSGSANVVESASPKTVAGFVRKPRAFRGSPELCRSPIRITRAKSIASDTLERFGSASPLLRLGSFPVPFSEENLRLARAAPNDSIVEVTVRRVQRPIPAPVKERSSRCLHKGGVELTRKASSSLVRTPPSREPLSDYTALPSVSAPPRPGARPPESTSDRGTSLGGPLSVCAVRRRLRRLVIDATPGAGRRWDTLDGRRSFSSAIVRS